jgi:hypothetical protein
MYETYFWSKSQNKAVSVVTLCSFLNCQGFLNCQPVLLPPSRLSLVLHPSVISRHFPPNLSFRCWDWLFCPGLGELPWSWWRPCMVSLKASRSWSRSWLRNVLSWSWFSTCSPELRNGHILFSKYILNYTSGYFLVKEISAWLNSDTFRFVSTCCMALPASWSAWS